MITVLVLVLLLELPWSILISGHSGTMELSTGGKRKMHLGRGKCTWEETGATEHTEMPSLKSGHHHASNE